MSAKFCKFDLGTLLCYTIGGAHLGCLRDWSNNLSLIMVKTNRSTLHTVYNI